MMAARNDRTRRVIYDEKSCCDVRLLQVIIYFFNFLFFISSLAFIGLAVWSYMTKYAMFGVVLGNNSYLQIIILCFVTGLIVFAVATSGCWAVSKKKQLLLLGYTIFVLITLLMELGVCIASYAYMERLDNHLGPALLTSIIRDHSQRDDLSQALQYIHREGRCCGSQSFEDWRDSVWWQNMNSVAQLKQRSFDLAVPDFCCRTERTNCGRRDHPSNIYYNGCLNYLMKTMKEQLLIIGGAGFALALVQLMGVGFGVCLYTKWREFSELRLVDTDNRQKNDATAMHFL